MLFSNFTEKARIAISEAHDAAAEMGHNYIGSEHLLMGLIREIILFILKSVAVRSLWLSVKKMLNVKNLCSFCNTLLDFILWSFSKL